MASTPDWTDGPCYLVVAEAPSRFELAQDVLQTSSAPRGLVPLIESSPGRIRTVDPLFVRQVPSPLGHRTMLLFVERRPWDSNPQVFRPAVFKTASSPIRVTSVSYEQSTGDRNRTCGLLRPTSGWCPEPDATTNSCYPGSGAKYTAMLAHTSQARGRGFEPLSPDSKSGSLPLADPRISSLRVPCGSRTRLSSLEGWRLCRSANGTVFCFSGRSESRTRKAVSMLGPGTDAQRWSRGGCHHQLACPSIFKSSGGRNRTCTHPLNKRLPYRLATPEFLWKC